MTMRPGMTTRRKTRTNRSPCASRIPRATARRSLPTGGSLALQPGWVTRTFQEASNGTGPGHSFRTPGRGAAPRLPGRERTRSCSLWRPKKARGSRVSVSKRSVPPDMLMSTAQPGAMLMPMAVLPARIRLSGRSSPGVLSCL